ncbi:MarR family winged helix-turn-helix transcriptional regulator [Marinobacter sp. SS5-14b]|uniref:MarR family winged helix-turn-helix transcriptional regulator n=1 Tax=Marinobacter sp. SS5-14b TaxID=3050456 RepID=UPI0026DF57FC|nr:MarR family transcriptional regulator [Marinobacter sp. SS5-14b]
MEIKPCFNLKMRQANRVLTNHYDSYLRELGLTIAQFSILRTLFYMKQTSQKDLQEVLVLQQTTLTRNLRPLIRSGYIATSPSLEDRRVTLVSLTDDGIELFNKALKKWTLAQESVSEKLGAELSGQLLDVADAVIKLQ